MELQTVIFYGKAGAGKGTQAQLLKKYLEERDKEHPVLYVETGAAFREFATQDNFTARLVKETLDTGGLLPEFLPVWIWTDLFIKNITENEHIILDGLARQRDEVPVLYHALQFYRRPSIAVIVLHVSRAWSVLRLSERGRTDDTEAEVDKRLRWFDENVIPAIGTWRSISGVLVREINGEQGMDIVHREIVKTLTVER